VLRTHRPPRRERPRQRCQWPSGSPRWWPTKVPTLAWWF